jgi:hypothetical protein
MIFSCKNRPENRDGPRRKSPGAVRGPRWASQGLINTPSRLPRGSIEASFRLLLCRATRHKQMKEILEDSKLRLLYAVGIAGGVALGAYWYAHRQKTDEEDQRAWKEERSCLNVLGIETKLNGFEIAIGNGVVSRREKNSKKLRPGSLKQAALDAITCKPGYSYVELWGSNGFVVQKAKTLLERCGGHEASERITQAANHLAASQMYRQSATRYTAQPDDVCATLKAEIANTEIALRRLTKTDPSLRLRWGPMLLRMIFFHTPFFCGIRLTYARV